MFQRGQAALHSGAPEAVPAGAQAAVQDRVKAAVQEGAQAAVPGCTAELRRQVAASASVNLSHRRAFVLSLHC